MTNLYSCELQDMFSSSKHFLCSSEPISWLGLFTKWGMLVFELFVGAGMLGGSAVLSLPPCGHAEGKTMKRTLIGLGALGLRIANTLFEKHPEAGKH